MGEMVPLEKFFCRSAPWRFFARAYVMPWALQGATPAGDALEIGAGSGMMAVELLRSFPDLMLTVTDFDASMLAGGELLEPFGPHADVRVADATSLSFPDGSFDFVFSFIMLHHVLEWEKAVAEAVRVLRPGGSLIGYDLLDSRTFRLFHRLERAEVRLMTMRSLYASLDALPVDRVVLTPGRFSVRFKIRNGS